jgi:heme ABC exporter ATP-binding subunit CcmA
MGAEANPRDTSPRCAGFDRFAGPFVDSDAINRPEASVPAVVRLRSAVCLLGRFPALAGVDLDVANGEIVLLSGANGAGKTTLLRLLAGLVPLYSGEATVLGHDLAHDRRSARRDLALVGHETFCYDDLTVRENLRFAARAAGQDPAEADVALERLGLSRLTDVVHRRLSAGQRRRLAVAVALSRDPRLLLLDEPHAGLDAEGREVLDAVVAAAPSEHRTVLLASHELDHARDLATREVVITAGQARLGPVAGSADTGDRGVA